MLNNDKMIIGYDLSYQYAQISYCRQSEDAPRTFELTEGTRQYNIPACLFKREGVNQWFLGKEAENSSKQEQGAFIDNLLMLALEQEEIQLGEETFETVALLALFVKRSLYLPQRECRPEKTAGIMFTLPVLTEKTILLMQRVILLLNMPECEMYFQSREESIYHYVTHQPKELWNDNVLLYDYGQDEIKSYRFKKNQNTRPMVAFVEEHSHGNLFGEDEEKDGRFAEIIAESSTPSDACVFLLGDGFHGEWCQDSLRALCHNRRVFKGNDLYSKGACFAMQEKCAKEKVKQMIFLSKDKLRTNVGMQVYRQSEESYLALLDGGENWYECKKEWDIILSEGNAVTFRLIPLDGRNIRNVEIVLDELPVRKPKMTRLHMQVQMKSATLMEVTIEDMGFGELVKSEGLIFTQQIDLGFGG